MPFHPTPEDDEILLARGAKHRAQPAARQTNDPKVAERWKWEADVCRDLDDEPPSEMVKLPTSQGVLHVSAPQGYPGAVAFYANHYHVTLPDPPPPPQPPGWASGGPVFWRLDLGSWRRLIWLADDPDKVDTTEADAARDEFVKRYKVDACPAPAALSAELVGLAQRYAAATCQRVDTAAAHLVRLGRLSSLGDKGMGLSRSFDTLAAAGSGLARAVQGLAAAARYRQKLCPTHRRALSGGGVCPLCARPKNHKGP